MLSVRQSPKLDAHSSREVTKFAELAEVESSLRSRLPPIRDAPGLSIGAYSPSVKIMASIREERFLMRQRGAGARQLRNSGFDLAIPGISNSPPKPIGSGRARRTPQSSSQPPSSSRRAPKVTPLMTQRSSKRTPTTRNTKSSSSRSAAKGQGDGKNDVSANGRGSSTRKRKLGTMLEDGRPSTEEVESEPPQTSQAEDPVPSDEPEPGGARTMATEDNDVLEDSILSTKKTSKKRKKRKSIGQNSRKRVRISLSTADATVSPTSPLISSSANHQQQDEPTASRSEPDVSTHQPAAQPQGESTVKAKRKKRKSIGKLPKVKRKSLTEATPSTQNVQAATEEVASSVQQKDVSSPARGRPRKALAPVEEVSEDDFDEELSSARRPENQEHSEEDDILSSAQINRQGRPRKSSVSATAPVIKKVPKPQSARSKGSKRTTQPRTSSPVSDAAKRRPGKERPGAIPITVHRLSRPQPTDYSSADEDILAAVNPFPKRSGVNAIDVLSQICREMVAKAAETLKLGEAKERGERKKVEARKRNAVEMFGEELDERLFQMTEALDNNYALTIRLRQANKEKVAKREELLEIKRLREEVAIEIDEVRAKHEHDTKIAQDELNLNTMISDIELAVQCGRALQAVDDAEGADEGDVHGLGVQLRTVAEKATSAGPGGGLLDRVRSFNRMVERAIAVL
ncbi:hypothetical protein MMC30_002409 [Trapelia coarctata]|nr:hypothetical protein [Trapelia coarctata]